MRIGWRQFIKSKLRKKSRFSAVGIHLGIDTASFCALSHSSNTTTVALAYETPIGSWRKGLSQWVNKNKIGYANCNVVVANQLSKSYQIEKPSVNEEEIHKALQWPLNDLLGGDSEPMVYDYFDQPVNFAGSEKVNVVAIPQRDLETVIRTVTKAGLNLKGITTEDLAICELMPKADEAFILLMHKPGEETQVSIIKNQQLYFSRNLKGFENLGSFTDEELKMGVLDSLSVQIQRSMDYFESQLRQAPVRKLLLGIESSNQQIIAEQIETLMDLSVESFPFTMPLENSVNREQLNYSCVGVAAALIRQGKGEGQ